MTPLDTLRAALELVEQQLAAATPGPWSSADEHGAITGATEAWCVSANLDGKWSGDVAYMTGDTRWPDQANATLIVTGVNLLPVVRDILADAIGGLERLGDEWEWQYKDALRLARAIVKDSDLT